MKRLFVALLVGGAVFGAVYGLAATLDVTGGTLQMSSAVDAVCDPDEVGLNYTFQDSDANPATDNDAVTQAQVTGIHEDCAGSDVTVELFEDPNGNGLDAGDPKCDEGETPIPGGGGDVVIALGNGPGSSYGTAMGDGYESYCNLYNVIASFVNIADWGP